MKKKMFRIEPLLLFCLLATAVQCQKAEMKKSPITGTWVEEVKRSDTIDFLPEYDGQDPIFWLRRGFRITEGYKLPDYFSGPYNFRLGTGTIALYWFLSSGSFQSYYFDMKPGANTFRIGNFFKDPAMKKVESDTLVFVRIK